MPTYDYRCQACQLCTTVQHRLAEEPHLVCPRCGSSDMSRIISQVAIIASIQDRTRDLAWVDRNLAGRLRKKVSGKLNPPLRDNLERMEKS
jgi:putative FmdB family regulatory protein